MRDIIKKIKKSYKRLKFLKSLKYKTLEDEKEMILLELEIIDNLKKIQRLNYSEFINEIYERRKERERIQEEEDKDIKLILALFDVFSATSEKKFII